MKNLLTNIWKEHCPFCGKGQVFQPKKHLFEVPKVHPNCPACGRDLIGEPGYFFGAMYVSYAIAVAIGIAIFFISKLLLNIESLDVIIGLIIAAIALTAYKNFKISRILWLTIFPPGEGTNFTKEQK